ncbi:SpoIIE family protein phosphatase [Micromonospora echinofusca]|uniref:SpoIIE family protein phosphatase n=1 Tax=Micromonospora echinofusca TaxID=47858 RepID=A0ABS3VLR0_MICEH|nr:SpoIIE family protein phosphatase [Micromonospora echinofusca]
MVVTDPTGRVTLVNACARVLLPEVTVGAPLRQCAVAALARAVAGGTPTFTAEHHGRHLSGRYQQLSDGRSAWYVRDVTGEQAGADALRAEQARTIFLAEADHRLGLSLHHGRTLAEAVTLPVPHLADAAIVVHQPVVSGTGEPGWLRYTRDDDAPVSGPLATLPPTAVPGLVRALHGEPGRVDRRTTTEPAGLVALLPATFGRPGALLTVPMPGAGAVAGVLVVVRRADRPGFTDRDTDLVHRFASRAGAALATAELYGQQAHLARVLHRSLLPPTLPRLAGVELAGGYRAAGDGLRIGGDFYEVLPTGPGGVFALGDVSGRGVEAAVLTGQVRQSLRTLRLVEQRPRALLHLLNRALFDAPDAARRSRFTTLLLGEMRTTTGGGLLLRIAGGGHPAPLVARADGTIDRVPVGGMPVGAFATARFAETGIRLAPGDLLLAYTDGMTEARGGPDGTDRYGGRRLRRALASGAGLPPEALVDHLLHRFDGWLGGQAHDDIAMLAIRPASRTG